MYVCVCTCDFPLALSVLSPCPLSRLVGKCQDLEFWTMIWLWFLWQQYTGELDPTQVEGHCRLLLWPWQQSQGNLCWSSPAHQALLRGAEWKESMIKVIK